MKTQSEVEEFVQSVPWWQRWEIAPGLFTSGPNDVEVIMRHMKIPRELNGFRVLDVGGWNGCLSFECERRGAAEVVMIEPTPTESTHFERIKAFLGSQVKCLRGTVYDLDPDLYGHFDIVVFSGVIYHLRHPMLGLDNLRRICRGRLFTESAILDTAAMSPEGYIVPIHSISDRVNDTPILQFAKRDSYFNDTTNWFIPNERAMNDMLDAAGFNVLHSLVEGRYYSSSEVRPGRPDFMIEAHEGINYELHSRHLLGRSDRWAALEPT